MPKKIVEYIEESIRVEYKGMVPKHIKNFCGPKREIVSQEIVSDLKAAAVIALKHAKGNYSSLLNSHLDYLDSKCPLLLSTFTVTSYIIYK